MELPRGGGEAEGDGEKVGDCMRRYIHESRTEDAGYRRDPERNTSPHLAVISVVVVPLRVSSMTALQNYGFNI